MKIVSWNIGNFIWLKHLPGRSHYAFQAENIDEVAELLKKEKADIVFLQEIMDGPDIELIIKNFPELPHFLKIKTGYRDSVSLFLSKYHIKEIHHTGSHDYIINGLTFFPVHLNAFSPKKRYAQANDLILDLPKEKGVILGDTNFWIFKKLFFSKRDKSSYIKIVNDHIDILKDLGASCRFFLSLDKVFITKDLTDFNSKIVKHKIGHIDHYMISCELFA